MRLEFSPAAETELIDVALFIAADNPERAVGFVQELEDACAILIDHPYAGVARPEFGEGIRSKPYRRYMIYYRVLTDGVRIERFLHGARDPGTAL